MINTQNGINIDCISDGRTLKQIFKNLKKETNNSVNMSHDLKTFFLLYSVTIRALVFSVKRELKKKRGRIHQSLSAFTVAPSTIFIF